MYTGYCFCLIGVQKVVQKTGERETCEAGAGVCVSLSGVTTGGILTDALHGVFNGTETLSIVIDTESVSCWLVLMIVSTTAPSSARMDACLVEIDDVHRPDSSSS